MKNKFVSHAALVWLTCIPAAFAAPADYVYTTGITQGEREIDFKYGNASGTALSTAASIGFGYGVTDNWFSEVYLKQELSGSAALNLAEFENRFLLTEAGKYAVDVGVVTEIELPLNGGAPWELRVGPLLQKEIGRFQLNGNLLFARAFGMKDEHGVDYKTNIGYQWQAKYRWQ